jgi:hypothetical protein
MPRFSFVQRVDVRGNCSSFLPILAKLPGDPFETKKLNKLVLENREFHKEEIDQHKKYFDEDNPGNFARIGKKVRGPANSILLKFLFCIST